MLFTKTLGEIVVGTKDEERVREIIDGFSKEVRGVAIALIGQFGKDESQAKEMSGKDLLVRRL